MLVSSFHIRVTSVWDKKSFNGEVTTKFAYKELVEEEVTVSQKWCKKFLWKKTYFPKIKVLCWSILNNKILSWDNLQSRGFND